MLTYYAQHAYKILISSRRARGLAGAVADLNSDNTPILASLVDCVPSIDVAHPASHAALRDWFSSDTESSRVLEVFIPHSSRETVCIVQLKPIETLQSPWAAKHKDSGAGYLVVSIFSHHTKGPHAVQAFHDGLSHSIQNAFHLTKPPSRVPITSPDKTYERLSHASHSTPTIESHLLPILESMLDGTFRTTVVRARQARDPTIENIASSTGLDPATVAPVVDAAVAQGLFECHHNVICPSCSTTLARVGTSSAVSQMVRDRVACPKCKAAVTATSHANCYLPTNLGDDLLQGSQWMPMLVRHRLAAYYANLSVLTSVQDGPNELDLVANLDGSLLLMELKDNRFSIGHAYSFVGKYSQYRPAVSVVVTTDGVDEDVVEYLDNTGVQTEFVHSLHELCPVLERISSTQNGEKLSLLLSQIPWTTLITEPLLRSLGVAKNAPDTLLSTFPSAWRSLDEARRILSWRLAP